MPYAYNLPAVDFTTIGEPTQPGRWTAAQRLDDIATALQVPNARSDIRDIKSIPDPWAQPLVFGQALVEGPSHEVYRSVVAQWRGMLALFGLQGYYQSVYQLRVHTLALDGEGGNARFRDVLRALLPTASLGPTARWDRLGVVTFQSLGESAFDAGDEQTVGLLSPMSLVAAGKGAATLTDANVPWMRNGLGDPLAAEGISEAQWDALTSFLADLVNHVRTNCTPRADVNRVLSELREFGKACREKTPPERRVAQFDTASLPDAMPDLLFAALARSPRPAVRTGPGRTLVRLPDSVESAREGKLFEGIVLVDVEIATRTLGMRPEDVRVWGNDTLHDLRNPARLKEIRHLAGKDGYLVLQPEDVFTQKLVQFTGRNEIGSHPTEFRQRLLPLSPLMLLLFGRDVQKELRDRLQIVDRGKHWEVSLDIDLITGEDGSRRTERHKLIRTYPKAEVVAADALNDLALWPNFARDDWPWNFLRFQYNAKYELRTRFALSDRSLRELIGQAGRDRLVRTTAALHWGAGDALAAEDENRFLRGGVGIARGADGMPILFRTRFADADDTIGEQHLLPQGADAVFFATIPDGGGRQVPAGCLLVSRETVNHKQDVVDIAIDFGTTNTVVYFRKGRDRQPAEFVRRAVLPLDLLGATEEDHRYRATEFVDFFPLHDQSSPFPTVVKRRLFKGTFPDELNQDGGLSDEPGVSDNIFFMPRDVERAHEMLQFSQLEFQLKWSKEPQRRKMIKRFLRQVMMMAAAEATADGYLPQNIRWHFSYPQAFSSKEERGLKSMIRQAWEDLFEKSFRRHGIETRVDDSIAFETEGVAALRLFAAEDGPFGGQAGELILMLDIGGGTTEIGLACRHRPEWRSSVKVAGGSFFTSYLANNLEMLKGLHLGEVGRFIREQMQAEPRDLEKRQAEGERDRSVDKSQSDAQSVRDIVELFVSGDEFERSFRKNFGAISDTPEGEGLVVCASAALGGMIYYAGIAARALVADPECMITDARLDDLTVAFAGRGSSLFRHFGPDEPDGELSQICRMFVDAARRRDGAEEAGAEAADAADPAADASPPAQRRGGRPAAARDRAVVKNLFSPRPKHEVAMGLLRPGIGTRERPPKYTPAGLHMTVEIDGTTHELTPIEDIGSLADVTSVSDIRLDEFDAFLERLKERAGVTIELGDDARRTIANRIRDKLLLGMREAVESRADAADTADTLDVEAPFITALRALVDLLHLPVAERDRSVGARLQGTR